MPFGSFFTNYSSSSSSTSSSTSSSSPTKMQSYLDLLFDFRRNQQLKKMRYSDFQIEKVLQKSDKNEVLLVTNRRHTTLGKMVLKKLNNKKNKKEFITNEINAGKKLKHTSIVKMIHNWTESDYTYLLFEYVEGKDLYDFLAETNFEPLPEQEAKNLFRQIIKAVKHTHKKGFVHGDLKLENIMITKNLKPKLIDFGFCTEQSCKSIFNCYQGSLEYLSPEILQRKPYNGCKAEVWSLGVILYTLLFGEFPFSEQERNLDFEGVEVTFPRAAASLTSRDLIKKMLTINPDERLDLEGVFKHPWLSKSSSSSLSTSSSSSSSSNSIPAS